MSEAAGHTKRTIDELSSIHGGAVKLAGAELGAADFDVDGERAPAGTGTTLRVTAGARRTLAPGPDRVRILAIGCTRGGRYERRPVGLRP